MVGSLEAEGIAVVAFAIFHCCLEMVGRERFRCMTVTTGNAPNAAAAVVTAYAIRILRRRSGGVMMTFSTISDHVDMTGVIKQDRFEVFTELVNPHLCRRRCISRK
jgi:hypothetical protein